MRSRRDHHPLGVMPASAAQRGKGAPPHLVDGSDRPATSGTLMRSSTMGAGVPVTTWRGNRMEKRDGADEAYGTHGAHGTDEADVRRREVVAQGPWGAINERIAERNALRILPRHARLLIEHDGKLTTYDSGDHRIGGVSQQNSQGQSPAFTDQNGSVKLDDLKVC